MSSSARMPKAAHDATWPTRRTPPAATLTCSRWACTTDTDEGRTRASARFSGRSARRRADWACESLRGNESSMRRPWASRATRTSTSRDDAAGAKRRNENRDGGGIACGGHLPGELRERVAAVRAGGRPLYVSKKYDGAKMVQFQSVHSLPFVCVRLGPGVTSLCTIELATNC